MEAIKPPFFWFIVIFIYNKTLMNYEISKKI